MIRLLFLSFCDCSITLHPDPLTSEIGSYKENVEVELGMVKHESPHGPDAGYAGDISWCQLNKDYGMDEGSDFTCDFSAILSLFCPAPPCSAPDLVPWCGILVWYPGAVPWSGILVRYPGVERRRSATVGGYGKNSSLRRCPFPTRPL